MKVKQLQWCSISSGFLSSDDTPQMMYSIRKTADESVTPPRLNLWDAKFFHGYVSPHQNCTDSVGVFDTPDEAKAACQAHFEQYITNHFLTD